MTVKQLTEIVNGRLQPTFRHLDADALEISNAQGNSLTVREDGLFFSERNLGEEFEESADKTLIVKNEGLPTDKIKPFAAESNKNVVAPETVSGLKNHITNIYSCLKLLKGAPLEVARTINTENLYSVYMELTERVVNNYYEKLYIDQIFKEVSDKINSVKDSLAQFYRKNEVDEKINTSVYEYDTNNASQKFALKTESSKAVLVSSTNGRSNNPIIYTTTVQANDDGLWVVDYTSAGFTKIPKVVIAGEATGPNAADRRYACINQGTVTLTGCAGRLASASSAGLIGSTMVSGPGPVHVIAIGS